MRVLHVGWGFSPWRGGGLIEYAEDLMEIQSKRGFEVYYFCSGRHYPLFNKVKLIKRNKNKINIFEVLNSPIYHGGNLGSSQPDLDIAEPHIEILFREVLDEVSPDIIHIQELAGLPSSLIGIAKDEYKIPVIMSLHNYFLLCPSVELLDRQQRLCSLEKLDYECPICCKNSPKDNRALVINTITSSFYKYNIFQSHYLTFTRKLMKRIIKTVFSSNKQTTIQIRKNKDYLKRRKENIASLNKVDLLIAHSYKVEDIYRNFLKYNNILTLHSTVSHLTLITPKKMRNISYPVSFGTLNGFSSVQKGALVLKKAIDILNDKGLEDCFHFHIWGWMDSDFENVVELNNVTYHGAYQLEKLNDNLELLDVGIVPSIWEEVYGYVGLEFLAKGIPVIGNKKGGIVDYTQDDLTGWVNNSSSPEELANIMEFILKNPYSIQNLNEKIIKNRSNLIKPMNEHFEEIGDIYDSLIKASKS